MRLTSRGDLSAQTLRSFPDLPDAPFLTVTFGIHPVIPQLRRFAAAYSATTDKPTETGFVRYIRGLLESAAKSIVSGQPAANVAGDKILATFGIVLEPKQRRARNVAPAVPATTSTPDASNNG